MNKIYKVIWSKVKNCYVVASELAKNHTKSPKSSIVGSVELENKIAHSLMNSAVCVPIISTDFIVPVATSLATSIGKKINQSFKITVAAIVKNEAENVPTWVEAARSCADEIVVVDTGSTDGTVERFADYGIKCFHYDWDDDFASAKNYMISLCHGDWIVLLDGDEWFREGCDVRKAIAKHHGNSITKAIIADWICLDKDRGNVVMFSGGAVRAFRNQPDVRYFRKVHENLTIGYENFAFEPEFKMYHTGYSGSVNRSKHERNLRIMRTMFDFDNGKVEYPTDWRYIEDTYAGLGDYPKALWAADKMISFGVQEYSAAAWITKFNVLFAMKTPMAEMKKQFEYCFQTVPSVSGFRFLASIYYARNGRADLALGEYTEGVRMLMGPQDKVAMEHTYWRMYLPEASALIASICMESNQFESALSALYVSEQYCGKTQWTDGVMVELHRRMSNLSKNSFEKVANRALPLLQFAKRGLAVAAMASGIVVGTLNDVNKAEAVTVAACVSGGYQNTASGSNASVSGGAYGEAKGSNASVSGGNYNLASGNCSSVSGGHQNTASGGCSSVSGGCCNTASGVRSSVSGGGCNTAADDRSSVSGGFCNLANNWYASISGGRCNTANGTSSSVSGGNENTANGSSSWAAGGCSGYAYANYSSAIGGGIAGNATCAQNAQGSVAIGSGSQTTKDYEVAIGSLTAPVTLGGNLTVTGVNTITDGTTTKTWADVLEGGSLPNTLALGTCGITAACASGTNSLAIGEGAVASGDKAISIGTGNQVRGDNSGAIGDPNIVDANNSYTVGNNSTISANVDGAFVLGNNVTVNNGDLPDNWNSWNSLTDEEKSDLTGEGVVALGNNVSVSLCNKVNSSRSSSSSGSPKIQHVVAVGDSTIVGEENGVAIGYQAEARALNALASGTCAKSLSCWL